VNTEVSALVESLVGAGVDGLVDRVRIVPDSSLSVGGPSSHGVVGVLGGRLPDLSGEEVCESEIERSRGEKRTERKEKGQLEFENVMSSSRESNVPPHPSPIPPASPHPRHPELAGPPVSRVERP